MSEDFLRDMISAHDFENRRIPCKQKYWIKNIGVKIQILIFSAFVYFANFLLPLL